MKYPEKGPTEQDRTKKEQKYPDVTPHGYPPFSVTFLHKSGYVSVQIRQIRQTMFYWWE
jgi:hypothetical protein